MHPATIELTLVQKDGEQPIDRSVGDTIRIEIKERFPVIIGRGPDVDVMVQTSSVGRNVVEMRLEKEGVHIRDLGSGGGSAVEFSGERIDRPDQLLPDGSTLWIGGVAFCVRLFPGS